jgi:hypothetical protein
MIQKRNIKATEGSTSSRKKYSTKWTGARDSTGSTEVILVENLKEIRRNKGKFLSVFARYLLL